MYPVVMCNAKRMGQSGEMSCRELRENASDGNRAMWQNSNLLGSSEHGAAAESASKRVVATWCVIHADTSGEVHHVHRVTLGIVLQSTR